MTEFTVHEDVGQVELCLVVTSDVNFTGIYRIGAETMEGIAGIVLTHHAGPAISTH